MKKESKIGIAVAVVALIGVSVFAFSMDGGLFQGLIKFNPGTSSGTSQSLAKKDVGQTSLSTKSTSTKSSTKSTSSASTRPATQLPSSQIPASMNPVQNMVSPMVQNTATIDKTIIKANIDTKFIGQFQKPIEHGAKDVLIGEIEITSLIPGSESVVLDSIVMDWMPTGTNGADTDDFIALKLVNSSGKSWTASSMIANAAKNGFSNIGDTIDGGKKAVYSLKGDVNTTAIGTHVFFVKDIVLKGVSSNVDYTIHKNYPGAQGAYNLNSYSNWGFVVEVVIPVKDKGSFIFNPPWVKHAQAGSSDVVLGTVVVQAPKGGADPIKFDWIDCSDQPLPEPYAGAGPLLQYSKYGDINNFRLESSAGVITYPTFSNNDSNKAHPRFELGQQIMENGQVATYTFKGDVMPGTKGTHQIACAQLTFWGWDVITGAGGGFKVGGFVNSGIMIETPSPYYQFNISD